jgi:N-acyl-phosphatidylethanolamine-hydrolysing phospholipase D
VARDDEALRGKIRRVAWEWATGSHPPDPDPADLPRGEPDLSPAGPGQARITYVGHATTLVRLPGLTLLTDPVWSERCSPVPFWGPKRFTPARPELDELPEVDAVLLSHDHFDHLDRRTVVALNRRFGDGLTWYTPLGYRDWFRKRGVEKVVELDWWEEAPMPRGYRAVCLPARHWTRRRPWGTNTRLWCGWAVLPEEGAHPGAPVIADTDLGAPATRPPRLYFAGDSGWCPAFREIGERLGPFDVSLIPIGAYEPRWFMKASHINPEEAVRAYQEAGGEGVMVPIHWGTWRLTFEDPLEPPERMRTAWAEAGLPAEELRLLRHGESLLVSR